MTFDDLSLGDKQEAINDITLLSNDFMKCFLKEKSCVEATIRRALQNHNLVVTDAHPEYNLQNLFKHESRLDIYAKDSDGTLYDIEIQCTDKDFPPKRARYYNGMVDTNTLPSGSWYNELPKLYIIVIAEKDILGKNLPIYHAERIIKETGESFGDDVHIIYINCQIADDTELGDLVRDFTCTKASEMSDPAFAERMHFLKETEEGRLIMSDVLEKYAAKAVKQAKSEAKAEIIKNMLADGMACEKIANLVSVPLTLVKEIQLQQSA